jgi:hypothetical protein
VTDAVIVGVYRQRNAAHVRRLLEPALDASWMTGWWALDRIAPELSHVTVGTGPGLKLPLLNRTLEAIDASAPWTVLADDDMQFRRGDAVQLVQLCERARLDLAQPARAPGTHRSHGLTTRIGWSRARTTDFVESGPLVVVGPRFRERILPLPDERGMGWGVELDWFDLLDDGCALGIVDAVTIEHLEDLGQDYDPTDLHVQLLHELAAHGHPEWQGMRTTLQVWRPWQRSPPWARAR